MSIKATIGPYFFVFVTDALIAQFVSFAVLSRKICCGTIFYPFEWIWWYSKETSQILLNFYKINITFKSNQFIYNMLIQNTNDFKHFLSFH